MRRSPSCLYYQEVIGRKAKQISVHPRDTNLSKKNVSWNVLIFRDTKQKNASLEVENKALPAPPATRPRWKSSLRKLVDFSSLVVNQASSSTNLKFSLRQWTDAKRKIPGSCIHSHKQKKLSRSLDSHFLVLLLYEDADRVLQKCTSRNCDRTLRIFEHCQLLPVLRSFQRQQK